MILGKKKRLKEKNTKVDVRQNEVEVISNCNDDSSFESNVNQSVEEADETVQKTLNDSWDIDCTILF